MQRKLLFQRLLRFQCRKWKNYPQGFELVSLDFNQFFQIENSTSFAEHEYDFDHSPNGIKSGNQIDSAPELLANTRLIFMPKEDKN